MSAFGFGYRPGDVRVVVHPLVPAVMRFPRIKVSPGLRWISDECRADMNAFLAGLFYDEKPGAYQVGDTIYCHASVYQALRANVERGEPT